jgi:hypothetical protein
VNESCVCVYWLTRVHTFLRHLHEDEEIRFILSGSCYFDVRGAFENRFIYHRFTLDESNQVKALRLFKVRLKKKLHVIRHLLKAVYYSFRRNQSGSLIYAVQRPTRMSIVFSTSIRSRLLQ